MKRKVKIAVTMGDAAGIGPELAVRAAAEPRWRDCVEFAVFGDREVLKKAAGQFSGGELPHVWHTGSVGDFVHGKASGICGALAYETIKAATLAVLDRKFDALVTAPVNKYSVNLAGVDFTGHTELIAELCGVKDYAMMQSAGDLRVAFVTTHIALAQVAQSITVERIVRVAELLNEAVRREGIATPRLAMAAINPHAGENGFMGDEDKQLTFPAAALLRKAEMDMSDPFPPDTLFIESIRKRYDGIVSMYHDQGHIPFKMLAFDCGVNSTLGLPIVRTSPDHGTAFEIAWKGVADTGSFYAAIELAAKLSR